MDLGVLEPWPVARGSGLVPPIGAKNFHDQRCLGSELSIKSGWVFQKAGGRALSSPWWQDNLVVGFWNPAAQTRIAAPALTR